MDYETFDTVNAAVIAYRTRIWGVSRAKACGYKWNIHGACTTYTFKVGNIIWKAYFDNFGRATTERAS